MFRKFALTPAPLPGRGRTGRTFNSLVGWERNNFDRVVHFSYGLLFAMGITLIINWRYQRDFAREWVESLRVKRKAA